MTCRKCDLTLIIKNVEMNKHTECKACNLGCFTSNCTCKYYVINTKEYWCEKCNIEHISCKKCNNLYDKLNNNYCYECVKIIKRNNPSTNDNIYNFDETYVSWELCKKKCEFCNCIKKIDEFKFNYDTCNYCELQKELDKIKKNSDVEFMIIKNEIKGRKLCLCGSYTDWVDKFYIVEDHKLNNILQCKNCDPSSDLYIYNYSIYNHVWNLEKSGIKCKLCDVILWKINDREYWGDIIQCKMHKPQNTFIKFKCIDGYIGYKIDKIKVFSNGKHYWKNPSHNITTNYECECVKCKIP